MWTHELFPVGGRHASLDCLILPPIGPDALGRPFLLVVPGGGYHNCALREAEPIAAQATALGWQSGVLTYSCAPEARFPEALAELCQAVKTVREHASEWQVDPSSIVVIGFSAGGHLAASLGCFWHEDWLDGVSRTTKEERRPNGLMLCYPVITSGPHAHRGSFQNLLGPEKCEDVDALGFQSLEKQVNAFVPPCFIWHTWTDQGVPVENSLLFALALREHGVSCELHVFPHGEHGLSLATDWLRSSRHVSGNPQTGQWVELARTWMLTQFPFTH